MVDAANPAADAAPPDERARRIVDRLIEERARHLVHHPIAWPLIRTFAYPVLHYRRAIAMVAEAGDWEARAVMEYLCAKLTLKVETHGLEHAPREGPAIIVANHPSGIADGVAVYQALAPARPDLVFFANRDAIRLAPKLDELLIPVEWVEANRTPARSRETLRATSEALKAGRAVVIFPSGRLAMCEGFRLRERPWLTTPVSLARKYGAPIVPLHVRSRNSVLYYLLWRVSEELRDMTLFNELLNKKNKRFRLSFAPPIPPDALPGKVDAAIRALQSFVENDLAADRTARFALPAAQARP